MDRVLVRSGSMGRAVGALDVIEVLNALPETEVAEAGSDGAAWLAPVLADSDGNVQPAGDDPLAALERLREHAPHLRDLTLAEEAR